MRPEARYANKRLLHYTWLSVGLASMYILLMTAGTAGIARIGAWYERTFYPALQEMEVAITTNGDTRMVMMPAFAIEEMEWIGTDLLLIRGTMCKRYDYEFVRINWSFGDPEGLFQTAVIERANEPASRSVGCQIWMNWLLKDAANTEFETFFADIYYSPPHRNWTVHQRLGPFPLPPKPATFNGP